MWWIWRRQPVVSEPSRKTYRRTVLTENLPRILTADEPQAPNIPKEPRISKAEAVESLKRIIYKTENVWLEGITEKSIFVRSPVYAWTFGFDAGHFYLAVMSEIGGRRGAGGATWGKDPVLELSDRNKNLLFKELRSVKGS